MEWLEGGENHIDFIYYRLTGVAKILLDYSAVCDGARCYFGKVRAMEAYGENGGAAQLVLNLDTRDTRSILCTPKGVHPGIRRIRCWWTPESFWKLYPARSLLPVQTKTPRLLLVSG